MRCQNCICWYETWQKDASAIGLRYSQRLNTNENSIHLLYVPKGPSPRCHITVKLFPISIVVKPNNPFHGQAHQNEMLHGDDISNEGHIIKKEILLHLSYCYFCIPINLEDVIYLQIEYVRWIRLYWVLFSIPSRM